jgi:hypothetical protein
MCKEEARCPGRFSGSPIAALAELYMTSTLHVLSLYQEIALRTHPLDTFSTVIFLVFSDHRGKSRLELLLPLNRETLSS